VPPDSESLMTLWNRFQNRYKYRDQGHDLNLVRQMKAHYYAEVSFIDYNLGRLFAAMREAGVYDNTMVIFTADHGELLGDYGCYGKRCFLDAAAKIPLLVKHPAIIPGTACTTPVTLVDILPTVLEAAEIDPQDDYSGDSLFGVLDGSVGRDAVFCQYEQKQFASYMIRTHDYKYIYSAPDETEYLFDMVRDPEETRNRAANPLFTEKTSELRRRLIGFLQSDGYLAPIQDGEWKRYGKKTMPTDPDAYLLFQDPPDSIPDIEGYRTDANTKRYFSFHWYEDRYESV
jgi:arylsulfatase